MFSGATFMQSASSAMIWGGGVSGSVGEDDMEFWEDLRGRWRGLGWRGGGTPIRLEDVRA